MNTPGEFDIGPLSWVKGEIDLALNRAGEALQKFAETPTDAAQLKAAQGHLHQAQGALSIVGLAGITHFAETIEQVFVAMENCTTSASVSLPPLPPLSQQVDVCQRALVTITRYLDDLIDGVPDRPLKLLPAYRELMALVGIAEASPADLFFPDLSLRPPRREKEPAELGEEALLTRFKAARLGFQRGLLKWLKGDTKGLTEMRNSVAVIEFTQIQPAARSFWWIALAFIDAVIAGGITVDAGVKRLFARIDAQIAKLHEGSPVVAERLVRDVLYCVANASASTDHIECVRAAFRLAELMPLPADAAGANEIAPRLPQLRAMREMLVAAKDEWNRYFGGNQSALSKFHEYASQLAAQGQALGQMDLARLLAAIGAVAGMLRNQGAGQQDREGIDGIALEIATALLLAENALEGFDHLGVDFAHQVDVMAGRLNALLRGETPAALQSMKVPQLDDISQRAQERLLMSQVAREILGNLAAIEQSLDAFFRNPQRADELAALSTLAAPLKQVEGALTMLGQTRAAEVLRECEQQVAGFAGAAGTPVQQDFEDLAKKLSALGFFVEQLQRGPADIDAILNPASVSAVAEEVRTVPMGQTLQADQMAQMEQMEHVARMTRTAIGVMRLSPEDEEVRKEIRQHMETLRDLRDEAGLPLHPGIDEQASAAIESLESASTEIAAERLEQVVDQLAPSPSSPPAPSAEAARLVEASSEAIDAELLAIFLEEAHEVLDTTAGNLQRSLEQPHDHEALQSLRRAFHTLKGSGRMVGLTDLGEAAWAVEQAMNHWLQLEQDAAPQLHHMLKKAQALFTGWVARIENGSQQHLPAGAIASAIADLVALCEDIKAGAFSFGDDDAPVMEPEIQPALNPALDVEAAKEEPTEVTETTRTDDIIAIGDLRLTHTVYDIYLAEVRTHLDVLKRDQPALQQAPATVEMLRASHTLGGISSTLGVGPVSDLARALESALGRFAAVSAIPDEAQAELFAKAIRKLEAMLAAFAMRRMPEADADMLAALEDLSPMPAPSVEPSLEEPVTTSAPLLAELPIPTPTPVPDDAAVTVTGTPLVDARQKLRIHDDLDAQLLPIFLDEGMDLLREIGAELRVWRNAPEDRETPRHLQRLLHTLKGGARMAGAMRMGELVHGIETRIEQGSRSGHPAPALLDEVEASFDRALAMLDELAHPVTAVAPATVPETPDQAAFAVPEVASETAAEDVGELDEAAISSQRTQLRIRAETVDQLINEAGEIAIARSRIEGEMRTLKSSLLDLTENVTRLRQQLREIEIQAESQMQSQLSQMQESPQQFDPLEMDRFTRFQELTRMMAESVNDVTTVQHNLLRNLDHTNAAISAQARLNRELSQSLMSVRMVPFNSIIDRLYRVVRQSAKELDKRVNFDQRGAQLELDRSVLDKMTGPLEHLLRNAIVHGIESRDERRAAGKTEIGEITLSLAQQGNEVVIELADDGAGLDFACIRAKAIEQGLLDAADEADERRLNQLVFLPGFSTAGQLSELAGRGVGLDVVKTETAALGGRIDIHSQAGQGTRFRIFLPLTLAVTQALLVRVGQRVYALPSTMIEQVMELKSDAAAKIRTEAGTRWLETHYPWHYLSRLLGEPRSQPPVARRHWILLLKGGEQHIALEVDGLLGNQEIVVKNIGPQLARVPGITGATVLSDGTIALILNPLALASRQERLASLDDVHSVGTAVVSTTSPAQVPNKPIIMVVDDSLTVRKIVDRLLTREGYQVVTAKDGVDALEQLLDLTPAVMLVDIEMPRMDGFGLTRNVRADARLKDVPIIMITSRIAQKHRNYAQEIGVNEYLGKPYDENELLKLIAGFVARQGMQVPAKS